MKDFFSGMATIGQLNPVPPGISDMPSTVSAWQGVASSFYQTGDSIRSALQEFSDAQRKNRQAY
jgi:hypothetical protein